MKNTSNNERGFSVLEGILVFIVLIVIIVVGGIVYFAHSVGNMCGEKSSTYKTELRKSKVFNAVTVLPGQPNQPTGIYDSSDGSCNIDVAQSYSATKSFTVSMDGATAINTVAKSLNSQGFKDTKEIYNGNDCSNVSGYIDYSGKGIVIDVSFYELANDKCQSPRGPTIIQKPAFVGHTITSIQATVSTPNQT